MSEEEFDRELFIDVNYSFFLDLRTSLGSGNGMSEIVETYQQRYPQFAKEIEQSYLANLEIGMCNREEMFKMIISELYSEEVQEELRDICSKYGLLVSILELRVNLIRNFDIESRLTGIGYDIDSVMQSLNII